MSTRCVLVADEDQDTRIILRTLLERDGYTVIEAPTARAAMDAVHQPVSLVILNYPMRIDESLNLCSWLRRQAATRDVPIINLTSRAVPLLIEQAARDGVTVTMAKPIDVQRMLELVAELTQSMAVQ
ncbi:MAG TPA: response regulator [Longimicrobiales bacterium]|nr:response regulator [Longimicrobiales bacterium]